MSLVRHNNAVIHQKSTPTPQTKKTKTSQISPSAHACPPSSLNPTPITTKPTLKAKPKSAYPATTRSPSAPQTPLSHQHTPRSGTPAARAYPAPTPQSR
ncbi:uncharacterized protein K452DRAFT_285630 [Aplosporella prunicola CBS 121167]|uniref:Uncharacterized protein n=1 Tax=Aplosporella prunicola CBS 121167 TaxID=1176127 RepID=A0A6A6BJN8_9PEZI|nr:uncharacterized protein K452DRAFT_285630 [Aplosporella prunicola CBS 121167]KAF2143593.1 hypothetical protein K452DRAFT_285630 [Aplosporella prunicola CBS 121167]